MILTLHCDRCDTVVVSQGPADPAHPDNPRTAIVDLGWTETLPCHCSTCECTLILCPECSTKAKREEERRALEASVPAL